MIGYRKMTQPGSCVLSCTCFCVEFGIGLKELVLKYPLLYKLERFPCEVIHELLFLSSSQIRTFRDMVPPTLCLQMSLHEILYWYLSDYPEFNS